VIAPRSLGLRLLAGAALWTAGALVIAWLALSRIFEDYLDVELARRMEASLNELADRPRRLRLAVAESAAVTEAAAASFRGVLALSLGALGVTIALAAVAQVLGGLRPLGRLRVSLNAVRQGLASRVPGTYPNEVQPLVEDLNAVLAQNEAIIARARTQAGNLAHGLKTPLAVLANEAAQIAASGDGRLAARIALQVERMQRHVDHQLARARAAASLAVPGARTPVGESLAGLARVMAQVYRERGLRVEEAVEAGAVFRGERQDLDEMLGNLLDNACKWARSRVRVEALATGGRLVVRVDDDGPGLSPPQREEVFARGRRLDESVAGAGSAWPSCGTWRSSIGARSSSPSLRSVDCGPS
jgi:signal transduction histidine kinase